MGHLGQRRLEGTDARRSEGVVEERAQLLVLGIVEARERGRRQPAVLHVQLLDPLGPRHVIGTLRPLVLHGVVAEPVRIHHDLADVVVPGDDVHPRGRIEPHRGVVAQLPVGRVRALRHGRIEEVDGGHRAGTSVCHRLGY